MDDLLTTGRIDTHSHLLPGVDDGCADYGESIACAAVLVENGYTHAFCTPHIWPSLPHNTVELISQRTRELQQRLDEARVGLTVLPGGELNLRPHTPSLFQEEVPTYAMAGRYCLFDLWADRLPPFFDDSVRHLQSLGLTVILAHPERMRVVQDDPAIIDKFQEMGLFLQGNLQCLGDPPHSLTRRTIERFLLEDRYFCLGSDTHKVQTMGCRIEGLKRAIELLGTPAVDRLTITNPRKLFPKA